MKGPALTRPRSRPNAPLRSMMQRHPRHHEEFLPELAQASGLTSPTSHKPAGLRLQLTSYNWAVVRRCVRLGRVDEVVELVDAPSGTPQIISDAAGYSGHNIVFIVGAPRSGTTWLQRLLATHRSVRTGQESNVFRWYIAHQVRMWAMETGRATAVAAGLRPVGRGGTGLSCYFSEDEFFAQLRQYLFSLLQPMIGTLQDGELFIEKTPSHALCIPEIKRLLPDSRIIHILRDPRDVVASLLAVSRSWGAAWAPHHAAEAAILWADHVRSVRSAARQHFPEESLPRPNTSSCGKSRRE